MADVKVSILEKDGVELEGPEEYTLLAEDVPITPIPALPGATTVQEGLDGVKDLVATSASPGFTWGRSGKLPSKTWLLNESVPSNRSGRTLMFSEMTITDVFVATEDIDTYELSIYSHDGDEINLTLLTTVSINAVRAAQFTVSVAVPQLKQLAAKIETGSAKNITAGIVLKAI